MQCYLVIWPRAATLSLRFLIGRIPGVLSPVVPQAGGEGARSLSHAAFRPSSPRGSFLCSSWYNRQDSTGPPGGAGTLHLESVVSASVPPGRRRAQGRHSHEPPWSELASPAGAQEGQESLQPYSHQTTAIPPGSPEERELRMWKQGVGPRQVRCLWKERSQGAPTAPSRRAGAEGLSCQRRKLGDMASISGGGHGHPARCSRLENPMGRGAWRATVLAVAKSQTRLKGLSTHGKALNSLR